MSKLDDTFEMLDDSQEKSGPPKFLVVGLLLILVGAISAYTFFQKYNQAHPVPVVVQPPVVVVPVAPAPVPAPAPTKKVPTPVNIVINFNSASAQIVPDQLVKLESLGQLIKDNPGTMQISAYTDDEGSDAAGQLLSEQRAAAVVQVFKNLGVNGSIEYNVGAYGERYPIGDNSTEPGRALNRRVEIYYSPKT